MKTIRTYRCLILWVIMGIVEVFAFFYPGYLPEMTHQILLALFLVILACMKLSDYDKALKRKLYKEVSHGTNITG